MSTGSADTRLVVLRGNSASGKSAAARCIRERFGRGIAIVGQDNLRRDILKERDQPGAANIGLIDLTARYALDHGYHVIVEGILQAAHYREMLHRLMADHRGESRLFYFDVSFAETVRRHATKPLAAEFGEETMRNWYLPHDVLDLPGIDEQVIPEETSLEDAVSLIMHDASLSFSPNGGKN